MTITYRSVLNHLAGGELVEAIESDVKRCALWARLAPDKAARDPAEIGAEVIPTLMLRWQCILESGDSITSPLYRHTTALALATALHQQGFASPALTVQALAAISALNDAVALSDHFHRKSAEIASLLQREPVMPARRPGMQKSFTQWRAGDIASVHVDGQYHAFYVLSANQGAPVVEFYDYLSPVAPTLGVLATLPARGTSRGTSRHPKDAYLHRLALYGLVHQPDPAHQFVLLASAAEGPDNSHLLRADWKYTVSDVFRTLHWLRAYR